MQEENLRKEVQGVEESTAEQKEVEESAAEQKEVEEKRGIRFAIKVPCILLAICVIYVFGFVIGQRSNEVKVKKAQQEANAKVETAEQEANVKVETAQQEANAKVETAQQEAIAKVEFFESKWQEEYTQKAYLLLEKFYDLVCQMRNGESVLLNILEDAVKMDEVLDELPYLNSILSSDIDEKEISDYIDNLKDVAEKYPLASEPNRQILRRLEVVEEELKDKIHSGETFEEIDALKRQCEDNIALWTLEK